MRNALLTLLLMAAAGRASAQAVAGQVVETGTQRPVRGALVSLRAEGGAAVAEALTDTAGRYALRAPAAGVYRLRADRIGHRESASPPLTLTAGATLAYRFEVAPERVMLEEIVATGDSRRCEVSREAGASVVALWEEARKSLRSAQVGAPARGFSYQVRRRVRRLDAATGGVTAEMADSARERFSSDPFVSVALERGYVEERGDTLLFHAPDARVLLSDAFLDSHCFRVRRGQGDESGLLGLAFEPVARGERSDVRGVLWLDSRTAELRYVDFTYQQLPGALPEGRFGGRVEFRRIGSGHWIVPRWRIRMPSEHVAARRSAGGALAPGGVSPQQGSDALLEEIGEVVQLRTASGEVLALVSHATLTGTVRDAGRGNAPLAGARVMLAGTAHSAVSDAQGAYSLGGLPEGAYALTFAHPRLDTLGWSPDPVLVRVVPPERIQRDLAVPALSTLLASGCPATEHGATRAFVGGRVTGRDGSAGVGTQLFAEWAAGRTATVADARGNFRLCGLPAAVPVRVIARAAADSATAELTLQAGEAAQRDFVLQVEAPRGVPARLHTRLSGQLVDAQNGRPITGAVVRVTGTERADTTDRRGVFAFEALPVGSHSLALEHPAYGSGVSRVELRGTPLNVELRIPRRTVTLETVTVQARRMDALDRAGHRSGRATQVVTRSQVERRLGSAKHAGDLVRMFPGVRVREINYRNSSMVKEICIEPATAGGRVGMGFALITDSTDNQPIRRADPLAGETDVCNGSAIFLDDIPMGVAGEFLRDFPIEQIESIEYLRPSEAAVRMGVAGGLGAILIYTRGNGPYVGVER